METGHSFDILAFPGPENDFRCAFDAVVLLVLVNTAQGIKGCNIVITGWLDKDEPLADRRRAKARGNPQQEFLREIPEAIDNEMARLLGRVRQERMEHRMNGSSLSFACAAD